MIKQFGVKSLKAKSVDCITTDLKLFCELSDADYFLVVMTVVEACLHIKSGQPGFKNLCFIWKHDGYNNNGTRYAVHVLATNKFPGVNGLGCCQCCFSAFQQHKAQRGIGCLMKALLDRTRMLKNF
jgi:hypothetical protein